jgi:hypothetical protein
MLSPGEMLKEFAAKRILRSSNPPILKFAPFIVLLVSLSGCLRREGLNSDCVWPPDPPRALDLRSVSDRRHLVDDGQIAEELAIRYADAEHARRFLYSGHGGLIENGALRDRCMATLVAAIRQAHDVTDAEILDARSTRNAWFDLAVELSFAVLYFCGAAVMCALIRKRFAADGGVAAVVAILLASVATGFIGVQAGAMWGAVWEIVRVGNGHMSGYRAAHNPWADRLSIIFLGAVVLFWVAGLAVHLVHRHKRDALPV